MYLFELIQLDMRGLGAAAFAFMFALGGSAMAFLGAASRGRDLDLIVDLEHDLDLAGGELVSKSCPYSLSPSAQEQRREAMAARKAGAALRKTAAAATAGGRRA